VRPRINLGLPRDGRFLFWGMFAWEFGIGLYNLLLTLYMEELGASPLQIGMLIGIQGIARIAVTLPSGILAERFSRRKLIIWTTACTAPAALFFGIAQVWWQLIPGMVLLMAGNLGTPAFSSYIVDLSTPQTRARMFATIYTVGPAIATIISPTLGGFIAEGIALRAVFFLSAAAYATSTLIFSRISERPLVVHHHEKKASYREAFAVPAVRSVALLKFGVLGTLAMGVTFLPNYLEDVHGLSIGEIGRLGSVYAGGSVLLAIIVARVAWITGSRGIAIGTCLVACLCGVTLLTGNLWILAPAFLMRGGFMVAWSLFHAVLGEISTARLRSRSFALGDFLGGTGFGLAPFLAGALYDWRPAAPLLATVILAPVFGALAIIVERRYVAPAILARHREFLEAEGAPMAEAT
jgi:MFS family permease